MGQAEDSQANALDRAYEAEAAARKLEAELAGLKAKTASLEQVRVRVQGRAAQGWAAAGGQHTPASVDPHWTLFLVPRWC